MNRNLTSFKVYIAWDAHLRVEASRGYIMPQRYEAANAQGAANMRVRDLGCPEHYRSLIVVGNGEARVFDLRPTTTVEAIERA